MNLSTRVACRVNLSEVVPVNGHLFNGPSRGPWCGQTAKIPSDKPPTCQGAARSMELGWTAREIVISRAIGS